MWWTVACREMRSARQPPFQTHERRVVAPMVFITQEAAKARTCTMPDRASFLACRYCHISTGQALYCRHGN